MLNLRDLALRLSTNSIASGVEQRQKLMEKGEHPDVLVMTATPIPRTLALTIYGDLDVSVIDEMPPGRKPIITKQVDDAKVEQVYSFLKKQIDLGRQAYVVYPVIEESETQAMKAAQKMHEQLSKIVFPGVRVGLLHGKLKTDDKESAMEKFQRGETQILCIYYADRGRRGRSECYRDGRSSKRSGCWRSCKPASKGRGRGGEQWELCWHSSHGQNERG